MTIEELLKIRDLSISNLKALLTNSEEGTVDAWECISALRSLLTDEMVGMALDEEDDNGIFSRTIDLVEGLIEFQRKRRTTVEFVEQAIQAISDLR